uniref:PA domain-containing protein n=1 Tax=Serinus canaria TaxID=9135 RepID=A0A8C9MGZ3_SERCA
KIPSSAWASLSQELPCLLPSGMPLSLSKHGNFVVLSPDPDISISANHDACDKNPEFTITKSQRVAVIERGKCSCTDKIQVASRRGPRAAVISNSQGKGTSSLLLPPQGESNRAEKSAGTRSFLPLRAGSGQHRRALRSQGCVWVRVALLPNSAGKTPGWPWAGWGQTAGLVLCKGPGGDGKE